MNKGFIFALLTIALTGCAGQQYAQPQYQPQYYPQQPSPIQELTNSMIQNVQRVQQQNNGFGHRCVTRQVFDQLVTDCQ